MFLNLNKSFWIKVVGVVFILILFSSIGYKAADLQWSAKYSALQTSQAQEKADFEKQSREQLERSVSRYDGLQTAIEHIDKHQQKELSDAKKNIDQLRTDLLTGHKRLSVLVQRAADATVPTPNQATDSSLGDGKETTYLDGGVAAGLIGLGGYANEGIIQLTACQAILDAVVTGDKEALQSALDKAQNKPH